MRKVILGLVLASMIFIAGCASFDAQDAQDRLGVQAATMLYIEQGENHAKRAERVLEIVDEARTMLDFADVSVADVQVALEARIAERQDLTPLQQLAAGELITYIAKEADAQLSRRAISADQRVTVNTILGLVEIAASRYVPH